LNAYEKSGGNFQSDPFKDKLELIMEVNNLMDIQPRNGKYTWNNKRLGPGNIKEQLDIFLIHDNITLDFNLVTSQIIPSVASNHKPIAIKFGESKKFGPLPFRYNPLWINSKNVRNLVARDWKQSINGSQSIFLEEKIKNVKECT